MTETIRPEFLEAVAAARFNLWLVPLFLSAPALLLVPVLRRWPWPVIAGLSVIAIIATWISFFCHSETIWRTMGALAETAAETDEYYSDTDRVFGPFLIGTPFALFYSGLWCGISFASRAFMRRFRRPEISVERPMPPTAGQEGGDQGVQGDQVGRGEGCSAPDGKMR